MATPTGLSDDAKARLFATVRRDARDVLLLLVELVARAQRDGLSAEDAKAIAEARAALATPFKAAAEDEDCRILADLVGAVAAVYRQVGDTTAPEETEGRLRDALEGQGYRPTPAHVAALVRTKRQIQEPRSKADLGKTRGPTGTAQLALATVASDLVAEKRQRWGLDADRLESLREGRGASTVRDMVRTARHSKGAMPADNTELQHALESLLGPAFADSVDVDAEKEWVEQNWAPRAPSH